MAYAITVPVEAAPPFVNVTVQPVAGVVVLPPTGADETITSVDVALDPPPPTA